LLKVKNNPLVVRITPSLLPGIELVGFSLSAGNDLIGETAEFGMWGGVPYPQK
jgi:hypothetical protein